MNVRCCCSICLNILVLNSAVCWKIRRTEDCHNHHGDNVTQQRHCRDQDKVLMRRKPQRSLPRDQQHWKSNRKFWQVRVHKSVACGAGREDGGCFLQKEEYASPSKLFHKKGWGVVRPDQLGRGRPRTHWRDYIPQLCWEHLSMSQIGGGRSGLLCVGCCPMTWTQTSGC